MNVRAAIITAVLTSFEMPVPSGICVSAGGSEPGEDGVRAVEHKADEAEAEDGAAFPAEAAESALDGLRRRTAGRPPLSPAPARHCATAAATARRTAGGRNGAVLAPPAPPPPLAYRVLDNSSHDGLGKLRMRAATRRVSVTERWRERGKGGKEGEGERGGRRFFARFSFFFFFSAVRLVRPLPHLNVVKGLRSGVCIGRSAALGRCHRAEKREWRLGRGSSAVEINCEGEVRLWCNVRRAGRDCARRI